METANEAPKSQIQWGGTKVRTKRRSLGGKNGAQPAEAFSPVSPLGRIYQSSHTSANGLSGHLKLKNLWRQVLCLLPIYIFFYQDIYDHTVHITSKNVSWINVILTNEQINGKFYKQIE